MALASRQMNIQMVPQVYRGSTSVSNIEPAQHSPTTSSILITTSHTNEQTACGLFRLPPELRNVIYEFACTPRYTSDTFDFLTARENEPSINILLTCRLVCREAFEIYEVSRMAFWSTNAFVVPPGPGFEYDACGISAKHIHHMTRIIVNTDDGSLDHLDGFCNPTKITLTPSKMSPLTWDVSEHEFARVARVLFRGTPAHQWETFSKWFVFIRDRSLAMSRHPCGNVPAVPMAGLKKVVLDRLLTMLRVFARQKETFQDFRRREPHHFAGV